MSELNNTQVDDGHVNDPEMSMYNLIDYSYICSKTGSLWKYYRDEPA